MLSNQQHFRTALEIQESLAAGGSKSQEPLIN